MLNDAMALLLNVPRLLPATAAELKEVSSLEGNRLHTIQDPGLLALPNHEDGDGSNEKNSEVKKALCNKTSIYLSKKKKKSR